MYDLQIERAKVNADLLHEEMAAYFASGKVEGIITDGRSVRVRIVGVLSRAEEIAIRALVENHDEKRESRAQQTRRNLKQALQSIAGQDLMVLDAVDVRSLVAGLALKLNAVNADGTVKPPDEWLD